MDEPIQPLDPVYTEGNGVTDYDGNFYSTVILGDQEWMAQNLRVTRYKNGVALTKVDWDNEPLWSSIETGAYAFYTMSETEVNDIKHGKYYNFQAVKDTQCLCPEGWRIPSQYDWYRLEVFLGLDSAALESDLKRGISAKIGEKLKSREFINNYEPFPETNISGFNAYRSYGLTVNANFLTSFGAGDANFWTTSIDSFVDYPMYRNLSRNHPGFILRLDDSEDSGFSVRCMREL